MLSKFFEYDETEKHYHSVGKVRDFTVSTCGRQEIQKFVERHHYSKNVNGLSTQYCFKLLDSNLTLIGAIIYGRVSMKGVWKKYVDKEEHLIELKRLCCIDNTPKNTESFFIGSTLRWLRKRTDIKKVISYADKTYGHDGIVYRATNFDYLGETSSGKVIMYNGKRYHDKTIRTKHNGKLKPFAVRIKEELKKGNAYYVDTLGKNIYLYNLK